ncbi:unnamed protein product [Closterium sp. Yama58-4]|nr:unnamed protein product [Closterium sp. Yama58-4]
MVEPVDTVSMQAFKPFRYVPYRNVPLSLTDPDYNSLMDEKVDFTPATMTLALLHVESTVQPKLNTRLVPAETVSRRLEDGEKFCMPPMIHLCGGVVIAVPIVTTMEELPGRHCSLLLVAHANDLWELASENRTVVFHVDPKATQRFHDVAFNTVHEWIMSTARVQALSSFGGAGFERLKESDIGERFKRWKHVVHLGGKGKPREVAEGSKGKPKEALAFEGSRGKQKEVSEGHEWKKEKRKLKEKLDKERCEKERLREELQTATLDRSRAIEETLAKGVEHLVGDHTKAAAKTQETVKSVETSLAGVGDQLKTAAEGAVAGLGPQVDKGVKAVATSAVSDAAKTMQDVLVEAVKGVVNKKLEEIKASIVAQVDKRVREAVADSTNGLKTEIVSMVRETTRRAFGEAGFAALPSVFGAATALARQGGGGGAGAKHPCGDDGSDTRGRMAADTVYSKVARLKRSKAGGLEKSVGDVPSKQASRAESGVAPLHIDPTLGTPVGRADARANIGASLPSQGLVAEWQVGHGDADGEAEEYVENEENEETEGLQVHGDAEGEETDGTAGGALAEVEGGRGRKGNSPGWTGDIMGGGCSRYLGYSLERADVEFTVSVAMIVWDGYVSKVLWDAYKEGHTPGTPPSWPEQWALAKGLPKGLWTCMWSHAICGDKDMLTKFFTHVTAYQSDGLDFQPAVCLAVGAIAASAEALDMKAAVAYGVTIVSTVAAAWYLVSHRALQFAQACQWAVGVGKKLDRANAFPNLSDQLLKVMEAVMLAVKLAGEEEGALANGTTFINQADSLYGRASIQAVGMVVPLSELMTKLIVYRMKRTYKFNKWVIPRYAPTRGRARGGRVGQQQGGGRMGQQQGGGRLGQQHR